MMNGTLIEIGLVATCLAFALALSALASALCCRRWGAPAALVCAKHALIASFLHIT